MGTRTYCRNVQYSLELHHLVWLLDLIALRDHTVK